MLKFAAYQPSCGPDSVKAAALAFGFWHLSDFSHNYSQQFGESPSVTLARARGH